MAEPDEKRELTIPEKLLYFTVIPFIFTIIVGTVFLNLALQDKTKPLVTSISNAVKPLAKPFTWAVGLASHKTKSAASTLARPSSAPQATPNSAGTTNSNGVSGQSSPAVAYGARQSAPPGTTSATGVTGTTGVVGGAATSTMAGGASENVQPGSTASGGLAQLYSKMDPGKAATIIGNMSVEDAEAILYPMPLQQRANIMAKLDPKLAATITTGLQTYNPNQSASQKGNSALDQEQALTNLANTFTNMAPQSAEKLIGSMWDANQSKVLEVLKSMDAGSRAQILSAMIADTKDPKNMNRATKITESLLK